MSVITDGKRTENRVYGTFDVDPVLVDADGGIKKEAAIALRFAKEWPKGDVEALLKSIEAGAVSYAAENGLKAAGTGAFNNARGDWLELIIAAYFWNRVIERDQNIMVLRLPNVSKMEFIELFDEEAQERIRSGLMRTLEENDARLDMSNPDLIGVRFDRTKLPPEFRKRMTRLGTKEARLLFHAYECLIGKCSYDSILFGISVKTSLRADRRYQIVHEGSIVKAFIAHLQTRYWDTSFQTKFYGAISDDIGEASHEVFRTAATHSIVNVFTPAVRAVDKAYHVPTTDQIEDMIEKILNAASTAPQADRVSVPPRSH